MISLSNNTASVMYRELAQKTWTDHGYTVKNLEGTVPADLPNLDHIKFITKKYRSGKERPFTDTEKAVWYSHWFAWRKIVRDNQPAIILEHDSFLTRPLPRLNEDRLLSYVKDENPRRKKNLGRNADPGFVDIRGNTLYLAPGSGYYLTPRTASKMVQEAKLNDIDCNSDGFIRYYIDWKEYGYKFNFIEQRVIGNLVTVDHGKNRTHLKIVT